MSDIRQSAWRRIPGILAAGFLLTVTLGTCTRDNGSEGEGTQLAIREAAAQTPSADAFQAAAAALLPSVVFVQTEGRAPNVVMTPFGPMRRSTDGPIQPMGSGSGVIFTEDGYIMTNNHVVRQAERVTVTLHDRRQLEARVVARDPATDIAVLKVSGNFPAAPLGNSDSLRPGQWVLALGSPLGLQFTVTAGIVSATGRSLNIIEPTQQGSGDATAAPLEDFIQTDAAINPGNSGGPLIDLGGSVIGINTAIASPTGVYAGYGFSVPINIARNVAEQLIANGEVRRPYLGVLLGEVDQTDAEVYQLDTPRGAEVSLVEDDGPAARAGVQIGDVIVGINGTAVGSVPELNAQLALVNAGSSTTLNVIRYGEERQIEVNLGVRTSGVVPEATPTPSEGPASAGIAVAQNGPRVFITGVQSYSAAARAGLSRGQEILRVNRQEISSVADLQAVLRSASGALSFVVRDPRLPGEYIVNYRPR
ncbi:MAG TPA: trypsin-like peptidase domain-containing protein [Gemmatimonadales bacterium]|nr:trypsin-like peptidase domain-containing protein [Gemmatimonadales bacterium]